MSLSIKNILQKPYDLLENSTFRYAFVFGGGLFAFTLLWIFEPFGLYNLDAQFKFRAISYYVVCGTALSFIQFFIIQPFAIKKHTIQSVIIWIATSFFIVGASGFIINAYLFNDGIFYLNHFILFQGIVLFSGVFSTSLLVLVHYNYILRKRLRNTILINNDVKKMQEIPKETSQIVIESENKKDDLALDINDLLYITTADNYLEVYYHNEQAVTHKLVRNSLTNITSSFANRHEIFRCHKSYIINKSKIESITGNAAGYKIKLSGCKQIIPVSRKLNKTIHKLI